MGSPDYPRHTNRALRTKAMVLQMRVLDYWRLMGVVHDDDCKICKVIEE